eukprot:CAMPEP_0168438534 /NCGR_PEP_ID=MMETSP0228-20121227/42010_1 /TAXON_ID=133427 /ORGANISM="Protoceratium reticulatum, Strain CCCM 535 (=CCMP 1889)" /LENGTH=320 /DNA_ID=CAMNT_0008452803 /DNA_START=18 /DNA_END=976 /DNA_ORIENTATION=-
MTPTRTIAHLLPDSKEHIERSYDTGKHWPKPHGTTSEIVLRSSGAARAVRTVVKLKAKDTEALRREVAILQSLEEHPSIQRFHEAFEDSRNCYLVSELCLGGALQARLKGRSLAEHHSALLIRQVLRGVRHMHEHRLCHRNLQASSVLLSTEGVPDASTVAKVGGFDLACVYDPSVPLTEVCGPAGYLAPEVIERSYSSPCDLWSIGVLLFFMLCGYQPFRGHSDEEVMRECHRGAFFFHPKDWSRISEEAKDLIRSLLKSKTSQRQTAASALHHEWFRSAPARAFRTAEALKALGGADKGESDQDELDLELDGDVNEVA